MQPRAPPPAYALHRLGAALHSFADTWAHDGFVGVADKANSIWLSNFDVPIYPYPLWHQERVVISKRLWYAGDGSGDCTFLGHTCILSYPDFSCCHLQYHKRLYDKNGAAAGDIVVKREKPNYEFFLDAALEIYRFLLHFKGESSAAEATFTDSQHAGLKAAMEYEEYYYDEALDHWYDLMDEGKFGPLLKDGNYVRYDGGDQYIRFLRQCNQEKPAAAVTEPKEGDAADSITAGWPAVVPYWVYHTKWDGKFMDTEFFKFCEATKRQREDVAALLRGRGIYI